MIENAAATKYSCLWVTPHSYSKMRGVCAPVDTSLKYGAYFPGPNPLKAFYQVSVAGAQFTHEF